MLFTIMLSNVSSVLHSFDVWGQPVPQINMGGRSVFRTRFGGCVGVVGEGLVRGAVGIAAADVDGVARDVDVVARVA